MTSMCAINRPISLESHKRSTNGLKHGEKSGENFSCNQSPPPHHLRTPPLTDSPTSYVQFLCIASLQKNAQEILCGSPPRLVINHVWPCLEAPFHALDTTQNNRYSLFLHCGAQNVIPTTHLFENQPPLQSVIWDAHQPGHLTIRLKQTRAC